jgi:hypothetical protein
MLPQVRVAAQLSSNTSPKPWRRRKHFCVFRMKVKVFSLSTQYINIRHVMKYCWRTYVEVGYIRSFDILFNTIAPNDQNGIVYYTHTKFIYKKKDGNWIYYGTMTFIKNYYMQKNYYEICLRMIIYEILWNV